MISFTVQLCFLFRFVCIELVSLIWFLQIWVAIYVYGTLINWSTKIKKLMQTKIVIVSGSILNISTVHLNVIWHLIWRYLLKPVLGGHPVLSGHYSISWGCPLNTGFTLIIFCNKMRCSKAEFKILIENFIKIITKENSVSFFVTEETSPFQPHCQKAKDNFICWKVVGVGTYIYIWGWVLINFSCL